MYANRPIGLIGGHCGVLDLVEGDRLRVAVGIGWNYVECAALGTDFATRVRRLEGQIAVMRRTERLVSFDVEFHYLDRVGLHPLPSAPSGSSARASSSTRFGEK